MSDRSINSPTQGRGPEVAEETGSDRLLLSRFAARRDEAAFAALVRRHGGMVLAVCRRVLRDAHAAEDACQGTFLVLARKAGALRQPELLGNWLYGVAYRVARRAQRRADRYTRAVRGAAMRATDSIPDDVDWQDVRCVLDVELNRLPQKYRSAVVLCYLEGLTAEEAARQLDCPRGTILSRLARARERLRSRLVRRGLALSAGALGLLLARNASAAPLPNLFVHATAKAARAFALYRPVAVGVVPGRPARFAAAVLRELLLAKVVPVLVCLLGVGLLVAGVAWKLWPGQAADHGTPVTASGKATTANRALGPAKEVAPADDAKLLAGDWQMGAQQIDGQNLPPTPEKGVTFTFQGENVRVVCKMFDLWNKDYRFRLDTQARPKQIDLINDAGMQELVGIYELDGDTFKLCFATPENGRPKEFVGKGNHFIWVFKRGTKDNGKAPAKQP